MDSSLVKVGIQTEGHVETLWAEPLGGGRYRLENSPFFAYGVSWLDVVEATPDSTGLAMMHRIVEKSGHRTIRVNFDRGAKVDPAAQLVLNGLNALGCTYEGLSDRYVSIDVPAAVALAEVSRYLNDHSVQWEYADPTYADVHGSV